MTWPDNWTAATGVSIIILLQKELFLNKITAVILGAKKHWFNATLR